MDRALQNSEEHAEVGTLVLRLALSHSTVEGVGEVWAKGRGLKL